MTAAHADRPSEGGLYSRLGTALAGPSDWGLALVRLGDLHRERGEYALAAEAYAGALAAGPSGRASLGAGVVALVTGDPGAERHLEAARDRLLVEGDPAGAAWAEGNLAAAALHRGAAGAAARHARSALARLAAAELPPEPLTLCNLGRALHKGGERDAAREALSAARVAAQAQGRPSAAGLASLAEGELEAGAGRWAEAAQAFEAALPDLAVTDHARACLGLAGARHAAGDGPGAAAAYEAALPVLRVAASPEDLATTLVNLGGLQYQGRDPARAVVLLDEAAGVFPQSLSGGAVEQRLRQNRGLALIAVGRLPEATVELDRAAQLAQALGDTDALMQVQGARVDVLRFAGALPEAILLQGAVVALEETHGLRVREAGMMYTPVEDRSLNISTAALRRRRGSRSGPVLFIVPAAHGATGPLFPRGAVSVASFLQAHGVPAVVLPLAHVAEPHLSPGEAAERVSRAIRDAVESLSPRAVGVSVTFSYLYPAGQSVAAAVRALDAQVPILIGGPHVTYQDEACLRETPAIDVVVRGEGEWTALALIRALDTGGDLSEVAGITYRAPDGSVRVNPKRPLGDVLTLPAEDFGLLPRRFVEVMDITALTSRGCAYRCRFCHEFRYWGGVVREHPVARVVAEMDRLAAYGNHLQGIDDSMLDMRTPFFQELVSALGRSPHLHPNFGLLSRLDTLTEEGARQMREAGMRWVCVGVESGSQRVLDTMNKAITVPQIEAGLRLAQAGGLSASGFLIIGHPGDSPEEGAVSRGVVDRLFADGLLQWLDLSTFSPYPGTPYFNAPEKHGLEILTRDWSLWRRTNRPVAQLQGYSAEQIYLDLLRMLDVQDRHVRGRAAPPSLGSGAGASG